MKYRDGYDRSKHPAMIEARPMRADEILSETGWRSLSTAFRHEIEFEANDGAIRRCRVNGALKTWRTRPGDFRLPIKYGFRECGAVVPRDGLAVIEGTGRPALVRL